MFRITSGKGFHLEFDTGVCISVQFGAGNYCENRDRYDTYPFKRETSGDLECKNAEIAIWDKDGKWLTKQACQVVDGKDAGDEVLGWLEVEDVAKYIAWAAAFKP